ncbi:FAA hydrolase family protein [Chelativorans sp. ZYF759]|uniref:fumarylacetoacetate hydrolase family protein n=1 Tax=Chelativorans sp. ZYF759 TaxID=2692213 RepID=UPI00145C9613|nr:fumarylacetoacetate hydrolase family protein [Chelativorans sp. ZYF759]NMG38414.1 FAA hydrolase family protein [Chelativorans sp. ZYF759]
MKLLRFGETGHEKPGVLDTDGTIRDVSSLVSDFTPDTLSALMLGTLTRADLSSLPEVPAGTRLGPPIARTGHFLAIGLNYADHAEESGMPIPTEPIIFSKAPSSLSGPNDDVIIPRGSAKTDWEVELAIIIGEHCHGVDEDEALSMVLGYALCNDVSERAFQAERGGQWIKGKSAPTFGPLGPWLVTADEIADPQDLDMFLDVNGERCQTGNTRTMIFPVAHIVSYVSQFMALEPGDIITTGTPPGVGMGMKPQRFLKAGDEMRLGIAGLGEQRQKVVAA